MRTPARVYITRSDLLKVTYNLPLNSPLFPSEPHWNLIGT